MSKYNCNKDCVQNILDPTPENTETLTKRKREYMIFSKESTPKSEHKCSRGQELIVPPINKTEHSIEMYERIKMQ